MPSGKRFLQNLVQLFNAESLQIQPQFHHRHLAPSQSRRERGGGNRGEAAVKQAKALMSVSKVDQVANFILGVV